MIKTILIANRGEIAVRIIKTAQKMGLKTIAIYSEIDANSMHATLADEAYCVGPAAAKDSYLKIDTIIDIAKKNNVDAIHPGYGFLAEDVNFAAACANNNITFIGPSAEAIAAMGSKSQAKQLMQQHDVPMAPGYEGDNQDHEYLHQQAVTIGFPLLIKASSGGGGKGMRLVTQEQDLSDAIKSAKREALSSFGDDTVLIEKYIQSARHVEVQIFCDNFGNGVYLHDRDCSIQRRHQKIIEEAPAPGLSDALRHAMGHAALRAAKAVNYSGAGTVEFLLDGDAFYFMEMNTRLQVEHPVTEMITGIDLVEWQILVADNERIEVNQSDIPCMGHAIEARICAENPENNFAPSAGEIQFLHMPAEEQGSVRVDTGIRQGDSISPFYDPMIAKVIAWGESREKAIATLSDALCETAIVGPSSNVGFVVRILNDADFIDAKLGTRYIEQHQHLFTANVSNEKRCTLAALSNITHYAQQLKQRARHSNDLNSPWFASDGWRAFDQHFAIHFWHDNLHYSVDIKPQDHGYGYDIRVNRNSVISAQIKWCNDFAVSAELDGQLNEIISISTANGLETFVDGEHLTLQQNPPGSGDLNYGQSSNDLAAPMHGTILDVLIDVGDQVTAGDKLMILEAMKMEHAFSAPYDGTVTNIHVSQGSSVAEGDCLLDIEPTK